MDTPGIIFRSQFWMAERHQSGIIPSQLVDGPRAEALDQPQKTGISIELG